MSQKAKREGPLSIPMKFDDAIKRAIAVKPPAEGWAEYEKKLRSAAPKKSGKGKKVRRQANRRTGD